MSKRKREPASGCVWVARLTDFKDDYKLRGDDPSNTEERVFWSHSDAQRCVDEAKLEIMKEAIEEESPLCFPLASMKPPSGNSWGGKDCPVRKKYYDKAREAAKAAKAMADMELLAMWDDFVVGEFVPRRYSYRVGPLYVE